MFIFVVVPKEVVRISR